VMSAQTQKLSFQRRVRNHAASVPVMIPPGTPRPAKPENAYEPSG
jgi:hypothetical protein